MPFVPSRRPIVTARGTTTGFRTHARTRVECADTLAEFSNPPAIDRIPLVARIDPLFFLLIRFLSFFLSVASSPRLQFLPR